MNNEYKKAWKIISKTTFSKALKSTEMLNLKLTSPYLLEPSDIGYIVQRDDSNEFRFILDEKLEIFLGMNVPDYIEGEV